MEHQEIDIVERNAEAAANLLKILAHKSRLLILCGLSDGEKSVTELEEFVGISQSAVSQHLACLRRKKIVSTRKVGAKVLYSLHDRSTQDLMGVLCQIFKK